MPYTAKQMQAVMDLVMEHADTDREMIEHNFPGPVLGEALVDDETLARFFEQKTEEYPPVTIIMEGETFVMSPWVAMLPFIEGGPELLTRYEQIRGQ